MTPTSPIHPVRRLLVILVLAIAVLGLLVFFLFPGRPSEPEYQSKQLSFWLEQEIVTANSPMRLCLKPEADEEVRQIGTNAIPVLLARLHYEGSPLRNAVGRALARVNPHLAWNIASPSGYQPRQATLGFKALGPLAKPAIPHLTEM